VASVLLVLQWICLRSRQDMGQGHDPFGLVND
jgi:hypothetical protein